MADNKMKFSLMDKREKILRAVKCCVKYISVFLASVALLTGLLVLSAMIPRAAIKENVREAAEYLCEGELFDSVVKGVNGSKIDRYADSILLSVAYQYDSSKLTLFMALLLASGFGVAGLVIHDRKKECE